MMPSTSNILSNLLSGVSGLGLSRPGLASTATRVADSGYWLALCIADDVTNEQLHELQDVWSHSGLLSITSIVVSGSTSIESIPPNSWDHVLLEESASARPPFGIGRGPMCHAATRSAEEFCTEFHGSVIGLSEWVDPNSVEPQFQARAEQQKSFVRCFKALINGLGQERISHVSLWTNTARVVTASQSAARSAGLAAGGRYEFCLPHTQLREGEQLLQKGEKVRMWFPVGAAEISRAVGR